MTKTRHFFTTVALAGIMSCMHTVAFGWSLVGDFEGNAIGKPANGLTGLGEAFSKATVTSDRAFDGGKSAKMGIDAGSSGSSSWGGIMYHPVDLYEGSELWFRVSSYFPSSFIAVGNPRLKFLRVHTQTTAGGNDGYLDLYILPNGQFSHDNEIIGISTVNGVNRVYLGSPLKKDVWETYEVYVKFSSQPGSGIYRVWQNGNLIYENKTQKTLKTASSYSDRSHIFTYWNGDAPQTQYMYIDDLIITSERPTCQDSKGNNMIGPAKSTAPDCAGAR